MPRGDNAMTAIETGPKQQVTYCGNPDHEDGDGARVPAVARVSWPDGRFRPTTACKECLIGTTEDLLSGEPDYWRPMLIEPIGEQA